MDLKKLAIITSAYTATKVWPIDADILGYCQSKMGGNWTDLKQIRTNLPQLKEKIADEFTNIWATSVQEYLDGPPMPVIEQEDDMPSDRMIWRVLEVDDETRINLETYAEGLGQSVEQVISEMVVKAFSQSPIAIETSH